VSTINNKAGNCLTEEQEIYNRWMEYCSELYNYTPNEDLAVLTCPQINKEYSLPILRGEVEAAIRSLKKAKSVGVDNIPAKLL